MCVGGGGGWGGGEGLWGHNEVRKGMLSWSCYVLFHFTINIHVIEHHSKHTHTIHCAIYTLYTHTVYTQTHTHPSEKLKNGLSRNDICTCCMRGNVGSSRPTRNLNLYDVHKGVCVSEYGRGNMGVGIWVVYINMYTWGIHHVMSTSVHVVYNTHTVSSVHTHTPSTCLCLCQFDIHSRTH